MTDAIVSEWRVGHITLKKSKHRVKSPDKLYAPGNVVSCWDVIQNFGKDMLVIPDYYIKGDTPYEAIQFASDLNSLINKQVNHNMIIQSGLRTLETGYSTVLYW